MTPQPPATSVVVVSRDRPALLRRALLSLAQQDHPAMEVVVVCDPAGEVAISGLPFRDRLKVRLFDRANIAAARNLGIAQAAGEVVAFLDDDAVAEPTWARRLTLPFLAPEVTSATGFVRGRNGLTYQWRGLSVDRTGVDRPLAVPPDAPSLHRAGADWAVKTVGTNCAFRRPVLIAIGGFDSRYRYFLDETDLNLRMTAALTAVVPQAQVIHGFAASANRRADRAPTDLTEIGASAALFVEAHCPGPERKRALARFRAEQRSRALRHLVGGALEPRDIRRLMASFDRGAAEGPMREADAPRFAPPPAFRPLGPPPQSHVLIARRAWSAPAARTEARRLLDLGHVVTILLMSPTARPHRLGFVEPGWWEQHGGLFGPSDPRKPLFQMATFRRRAEIEGVRMGLYRTPAS